MLTQSLQDDIKNHSSVYQFFLSAAEALQKACNEVDIEVGLQPIQMLNQEIENRWTVMTQVVDEKQRKLEDTQKKLKRYHSALGQVRDILNQVEDALESQGKLGVDADQAKVNRETLKVGRYLCRYYGLNVVC